MKQKTNAAIPEVSRLIAHEIVRRWECSSRDRKKIIEIVFKKDKVSAESDLSNQICLLFTEEKKKSLEENDA